MTVPEAKTNLRGLVESSEMLIPDRSTGDEPSLYSSIRSGKPPCSTADVLTASTSLRRTVGRAVLTVHVRVAPASASCQAPAEFLARTRSVWVPLERPESVSGVPTGCSALKAPPSSWYL